MFWQRKIWNGVQWERPVQVTERRLHALEEHVRSLEERYAELENRLNVHLAGGGWPEGGNFPDAE